MIYLFILLILVGLLLIGYSAKGYFFYPAKHRAIVEKVGVTGLTSEELDTALDDYIEKLAEKS